LVIKRLYKTVKNIYNRACVIPLNPRNKKHPNMTVLGNIVCEVGFAMHKTAKIPPVEGCGKKIAVPSSAPKMSPPVLALLRTILTVRNTGATQNL